MSEAGLGVLSIHLTLEPSWIFVKPHVDRAVSGETTLRGVAGQTLGSEHLTRDEEINSGDSSLGPTRDAAMHGASK